MRTATESGLHPLLSHSPYEAYTYAYPHKTAYRPLSPPVLIRDAWQRESRESLFLYLHMPFCEMRCGFCNLFTTSNPAGSLVKQYLDALRRQAEATRAALPDARFARLAFGGGTPTVVSAEELAALFTVVRQIMGIECRTLPFSVETSPATADPEKLELLRAQGVDRISLGVQSFLENETASVGRRQCRADVEAALGRIREVGFPILNIDLIYGIPDQSSESWLESLKAAVEWNPEELFLYPLYVRPLTGLGRAERRWEDKRLRLFRQGRDFLLSHGYVQISMRMFRACHAEASDGPSYCAQEDGMVGLGCGARSYTRSLQYSTRYAVSATGVRSILTDFCSRSAEQFAWADYGFELDEDEQHRRYVALTLLNAAGMHLEDYRNRFGSDAYADLPQLSELEALGLAVQERSRLCLTSNGLERSDSIGPWLYSERVNGLMESFALS